MQTAADLTLYQGVGGRYRVTGMVCWTAGGSQNYTGGSTSDPRTHLQITEARSDAFLDDFEPTLYKIAVHAGDRAELKSTLDSAQSDMIVDSAHTASSQS